MRLLPILLFAALASGGAARAAGVEDDASRGYAIETAGSTQQLAAGAKGKLVFTIVPRGAWHVDPRTPLKIDLTAPAGLKLEKSRLGKKDRAADSKPEAPRFEAPFEAVAAGTHEARARLDFFVCSANACVKQVRDVALPVTVR